MDFNGFCKGLLKTVVVVVVVVMGFILFYIFLVVGCGYHNGDYD